MKKRQYIIPLIEVEQISLTGMLMESPVQNPLPVPPSGPAGVSKRRTPVF